MKYLVCILLFLFVVILHTEACTTAIVSGKYTADGRPLLYKHRDTGALQNKLMHFKDGKYHYIGIVNSSDKEGKEVWGGYNSAGFAIMNSASYNLNPSDEGNEEREGIVMKMALQQCATLADFERLLDSLPKRMHLSANFGVIDTQGGAAYYETSDVGYKKFDVNDAPNGYLIRTNFSFSGDRKRDRGVSRYQAAEPLFRQASSTNNLSYRFLLQDVSRCLKHGITGVNLYDVIPQKSDEFTYFRDFIPRYSTSSVIVVQGIKEGESSNMAVMWTVLGSPLTTPAVPVLLNEYEVYPFVMLANGTGNATLCDNALTLKKQLFPIEKEEGRDYINLATLISADRKGILQRILDIENYILDESDKVIAEWREKGKYTKEELVFYYQLADSYLTEVYSRVFNIK